MNNLHTFQREIAGRILTIETGKLAVQADAAVTVRYGDTMVLVTCVAASEPRAGVDFLPLTIDYEERLYAAGKIPGGFIRREGRPSQEATLASRLTDRPLRPLLPKTWRRDIQITITVLSADQVNDADILAVIGGSAVLSISEIPFSGPVSSVRVGNINGNLVLNPTLAELANSDIDLVVASTHDNIVMVEAGAKEVSEELVTRALSFAHEANQAIIDIQNELVQVCGKQKVSAPPPREICAELNAAIDDILGDKLVAAIGEANKTERTATIDRLQNDLTSKLCETYSKEDVLSILDNRIRMSVRNAILERGQRPGGRGINQIRELKCDVGLLPRTHGSAMFTRGLTQVLSITTLGSTREEQQLDGLGIEETKRFIHHYNFPPFSTGEVGRMGSPGRREIGHGALAERALVPVIPGNEEFPYTVRLVSEVLSSNGSTSMASVCASSMSLMDAGIPIKRAVAGVAMGLITGENGFVILTDIEGMEDNYGDMDCKVAGTSQGITALQLDIKLKGITQEMLNKAIAQAKDARENILKVMNSVIGTSRPEISQYAPRMYKIQINPEKIGSVIGTGGKTIRSISSETNTTIDIQDDGTVIVGAPDQDMALKAIHIIEGLTKEAKVGDIYTGKVTRIMNFGAMVEILPGKEGMVHISELADYRVGRCEDVVKVGDEITVKVIEIDNMGRVNLSRRAVFGESSPREPREPRRDSGGFRRGPSDRHHDHRRS